ncbi:helix-turn-helix transcriptional regulator [Novosphingobium beihaiensis]|uniref:AraC family transcriptional regulator n=1 Tax=Novosphingobium beihaiensis TaxID=2930389 RepID=A0ABT0BTA6_9SPHN|nr:AraC family transcriptional regulator [Novosphingobium beihaiensis]MCJ2188274.1 AraC family transcriptional regulator [Novosphingobium beihaiensis]
MIKPLQSGTDFSDPGFNQRAACDRARIEQHLTGHGQVHADDRGTSMLVSANYPPFEGEIDNGPFLRIALATGRAARILQQGGGARLEGLWRQGTLAISPPHSRGFAKAERTSMIGLALLPGSDGTEPDLDPDHVSALAGRFQDDALLVSVVTALHHEAAIHGASTAFFDAGRALILRRLMELKAGAPRRERQHHPLPDGRYNRVLDYVEESLGGDISVARMAKAAGLDSSGFTRALRARTGLPPYAWLTQRRMIRAQALLRTGMPVTQVATHVGYANPGKFASAFKRVTGHAPSRWVRLDED